MESVSSSFIPNDYFWSREGRQHWHIPLGKGPWVSEGFLEGRVRHLALLGAGPSKDLQPPSLPQSPCQPRLPRLPLLKLSWTLLPQSVVVSADSVWPFAGGCRKRRMCQGRLFWVWRSRKMSSGEEKSLWEELVGMYMIYLVWNWQEASQLAPPTLISPRLTPAALSCPRLPPGLAGWLKDVMYILLPPPPWKGGVRPWLCLFFVPLAWGASPPSLPCAFLCLCSLISHDFANYTLLLSDLLLAPNSRKRRGDVETLHLSTGNWNSFWF